MLRITIPDTCAGTADELLNDRFAFDKTPFADRLEGASEVWIFAPSGINLLSSHNCELIRNKVLAKPDGVLRVVILNQSNQQAVQFAVRQLDDSLDYPIQDFRESLATMERQSRTMRAWEIRGSFDYRRLEYNPGFSIVAVNPTSRNGQIIINSTDSTTGDLIAHAHRANASPVRKVVRLLDRPIPAHLERGLTVHASFAGK